MKINITSLGCRLNQSEIQSVSTALLDRGHEITHGDDADVFIINSCAVTLRSERKTRHLVYRARNAKGGKGKKIIVAGCAAGDLMRDGDTYYVPNDYKFLIPDLIEDWENVRMLSAPADARFRFMAPLKSSTMRVNLKIQDGCDNYCSYCVVPLVRGKPQSKPAPQVIEEFKRLVDAGYKEIILTGVMIGKYESGDYGLAELAEKLLCTTGTFRIHLTSLTPTYVGQKLIAILSHEKMVKHLHLSLQSGSNAVLKRMNRPYTREEYIGVIESIRKKIPDFNFTTDVIVGFPGETEEDFNDTLRLIRDVGFSHVHTFRFSPRPGTAAAGMDETVSEKIKTKRSSHIITLYNAQKTSYYSRFSSRESLFLSESTRKGSTSGFNEYYVPIEVEGKLPHNEFFKVSTIMEPGKVVLSGKIICE